METSNYKPKQVPKNVHDFKKVYKEIVANLIEIRTQANVNQAQMAEWLEVDRRKIMQFEGLKKINLELLLVYSDKLSVDINFNFNIN